MYAENKNIVFAGSEPL